MRRYIPLLFVTLAALAFTIAQVSGAAADHCRRWEPDCHEEDPVATPTAVSPPVVDRGETRDPLEWPFAADSIWNMPIGENARYVDAELEEARAWYGQVVTADEFLGLDASAPLRELNDGQAVVRVPTNLSHDGRWNGCASLLTEDATAIWQGQPLQLTPGGDPEWRTTFPQEPTSLTGDGRLGCHRGSGLSGLGGTLRAGELDGPDPIRHALKMNLYARRFISCEDGGYRWPAVRADTYMNCSTYGGDVEELRMGSLLALPPSVDCDASTSSNHAQKLCQALQDYGAYVADDTYWDVHAFNADVNAEFGDGGTFDTDMQNVIGMLHVVDDNGPSSIGGPGARRAPMAPPFSDAPVGQPTQQPSPTNTSVPASATATNTSVAPSATATRTATSVPSVTPTPTNTAVPGAPTATATRTPTPVPPTATRTATATPTRTPTAVPATSTPSRTATAVASTPTPQSGSGTRNKYEWPFASNSIWNMPIGSNAQYVPAGISSANAWNGEITYDDEIIDLNPSDPLRNLDAGSNSYSVRVSPDTSHDGSWNGCASFLDADGDTIRSGQPLNLSRGGNPSWDYNYSNSPSGNMSLRGDGRYGCHGGSALSGVGGSIREGEMGSSQPLRHALKINVWAERFLSCSNNGYRWPAYRADGYFSCSTYGGSVPQMRMGSLVAILPSVNCDTFVSNAAARKICRALQDYGAYVVDDTYWDVHALNVQEEAIGDLDNRLGSSGHSDLQRLFSSLYVVDNNSASNIGGGGTPRAPLAPPISN